MYNFVCIITIPLLPSLLYQSPLCLLSIRWSHLLTLSFFVITVKHHDCTCTYLAISVQCPRARKTYMYTHPHTQQWMILLLLWLSMHVTDVTRILAMNQNKRHLCVFHGLQSLHILTPTSVGMYDGWLQCSLRSSVYVGCHKNGCY